MARSHAEQAKIAYDTTRGEKILHDVCGVRAHQLLRSVVYYIANEQFLSAKNDLKMSLMYAEQGGVTVERALMWQLDTEIQAGIAARRALDPRTWNLP